MASRETEITRILQAAAGGDGEAVDRLVPLVYDDLHQLAHGRLRHLRKGQALETTDLLHESWTRLLGRAPASFDNRRHFFGAAARAMQQILIEQARRRHAAKRDVRRNETLGEDLAVALKGPSPEDALSVGEALDKLEATNERPAEVVRQRFFNDLSLKETAEVLGISLATAERDWRFARAWLQEELGRDVT